MFCLPQVNITIFRSGGYYGQVQLWYKTLNGTAEGGMDFTSTSGELVFEPNEMMKKISIEILHDDLPEGPEEFSVVITKVKLQGR